MNEFSVESICSGSYYARQKSISSLYNIVAAIQRFLREKSHPDIWFFDVKAPEFDLLRKSLDARMKEFTSEGVGVEKQSAQPLTKEMEEILWDKKMFTPKTGI